jgi:hypothetical protein
MKWIYCIVLLLILGCVVEEVTPPEPEQMPLEEIKAPIVLEEPEIVEESPQRIGVLRNGRFGKRTTRTRGDVILSRIDENSYQIEFQNFDSGINRDATLVMSTESTIFTSKDLGEYVIIGPFKGNSERQYYFFKDIDVEDYHSLAIIEPTNTIVHATAELIEANS